MFGFCGPGDNDQNFDAEVRELRAHRFAETMNRKFAGRVLAFMRTAAPAQDRTHVDDDWLHALSQKRDRGADEFDRGKEVDFHDRPHAVRVGFGESAVSSNARVVDQNIKATELVFGGGECTLADRRIGYIASNANGASAELRDLLRDIRKPIFAARE